MLSRPLNPSVGWFGGTEDEESLPMRMRSLTAAVLLVLATVGGAFAAGAAGAQTPESCPAGQPPGVRPGNPNPAPPANSNGRPPQYPLGKCELRLSQNAASAGQSVTAAGDGYSPGATIAIRLGAASVGTATANRNGSFSQAFVVPNVAPGQYDVTASGASADGTQVLSASVTVTAPGTAHAASGVAGSLPSGGLPRTGSSSTIPLTAGAIALVVLGGAFLVIGRRRSGAV